MTRQDTYDVALVGAGIAGLTFVLSLPESMRVVVLTKSALGESNTRYAQGGLAAAVGDDDDPELHFADTITAGAGLCDEPVVRELVESGPAAVRWLLDRGTRFDYDGAALARGREAAHTRNRVLHAGGDATGAEIERALVGSLRARPNVTIFEHTTAIDLDVSVEGTCIGVHVLYPGTDSARLIRAGSTVLANGGAGQVWAVSSNPLGATGDGIAMALRAGAAVADLEFTQFHPTVLTSPHAEPFLISEAVRGEGAYLRSRRGDRFMRDVHPLAELAPRDVVARAIQHQLMADGAPVSLDLRHLDPAIVRERFPTISRRLRDAGLDLAQDPIPVTPAAHYVIGGVVAGTDGRTSMRGLLALGEVSCTGVHGANRLASNSLLEGLVFASNAAARVSSETCERVPASAGMKSHRFETDAPTRSRIQTLMSDQVAVLRTREGLESVLAALETARRDITERPALSIELIENRNIADLALAITESALHRRESRGAHYRDDWPDHDPHLDGEHQIVARTRDGEHRWFGSIGDALAVEVGA